MGLIQDKLDEIFRDQLGYEYEPQELIMPDIDGVENIINYSREYTGQDINIVVVECFDRRIEFQKEFIKREKNVFPNSYFLFVSNEGKVFDLYNDATSRNKRKITYDEISLKTSLFKEKIQLFNISKAENGTELQINAERAFETNDKVAGKFFDKFQKIHKKLQSAISGIDDPKDLSWYASVLMNRFMFIYFLQKHNVIQDNPDFLLDKFKEVEQSDKDYYHDFLLPLFFYGFARKDHNLAKQTFVAEFGEVRYLNGGLFYPHTVEKKYTPSTVKADKAKFEEECIHTSIQVDAKKIKEVLEFLNGYTWYLDQRPMKDENDINPDVLGYIFEKYINQKELGAYYTKEDITEYISKNTIIPFILDKMRNNGYSAPEPNPMITNNEDIIAAIHDYVEGIENYQEAKFLYTEVLQPLSVLDPSVGSGAFLFAALNILLPIYQKTVYKLRHFAKTETDEWLVKHLTLIDKHKEEYFLTKQIILNNLYGVDIVQEATEICKLRLFLQLVSHISDIKLIEPLPDIDFNIYAGNSLVGGLSWNDLRNNYNVSAFNINSIENNIELLAQKKVEFRQLQQTDDYEDELNNVKNDIIFLNNEIKKDLCLTIDDPFHWFIDFKNIIDKGGFDVIIGNPPYVEYTKKDKVTGLSTKDKYQIKGYQTEKTNNLYAYFFERSYKLLNGNRRLGFIVPLSISSAGKMSILRRILNNRNSNVWVSHYAWRPAKLFNGANMLLSILLGQVKSEIKDNTYIFTSKYNRWYTEERDVLFYNLKYYKTTNQYQSDKYIKIENSILDNILEKIYTHQTPISSYNSTGSYFINYFRAVLYWIKILPKDPIMRLNDVDTTTGEMKKFYFSNESRRNIIGAVLSSSTFFLHYVAFSSCQVINSDDFNFRIDLDSIDDCILDELSNLGSQLFMDYERNSEVKLRIYKKKDRQEKQHFKIKKSKHIIDEIDKCLAKVYGFTQEELDYIKNYDIKYRMGDHDDDEE